MLPESFDFFERAVAHAQPAPEARQKVARGKREAKQSARPLDKIGTKGLSPGGATEHNSVNDRVT